MALQIQQQHWKSTLVFVRKMMSRCSPAAKLLVDFEDIHDGMPKRINNERLWAVYGLGGHEPKVWWKASFTDNGIFIDQDGVTTDYIPYSIIHSIKLPEKSVPPREGNFDGMSFFYDTAILRGEENQTYEIKAGVTENGHRDIYLWHGVKGGVHFDRERHALENIAPP